MRMIWLMPLFLLLAGCPQADAPVEDPPHLQYVQKYPEFKHALADEDGYRDETKRLQGLYTLPPSRGHASVGIASSVFELSSRMSDGRVGLALNDTRSDETWVLWLWQDAAVDTEQLTVVEDGHTAGGYRLEFNVRDSALTVSVNVRWLQSRYLQVSRELILGGLDHRLQVSEGYSAWELDGPWLPYRMVPSAAGPYGVVLDDQADDAWHTQRYPFVCMVPAVAAYDGERGMLLSVADEHARRLDRDYDVSFRIPRDYESGGQARLAYRNYDPIADVFSLPVLFSGLAVRDSIVLEPIELGNESTDRTLVYAQTDEVIKRLGQLVRCFHFEADPPERLLPGGYLNAGDWVDDPEGISDFVRVASGIWGVQLTSARFFDATVEAGANVGLGAGDLEEGSGLSPEVISTLESFDAHLPVLAEMDLLSFSSSPAYANQYPQWMATDTTDATSPASSDGFIEIRDPEAAAWLVGKTSADIVAYPAVDGYAMAGFPEVEISAQPHSTNGFLMSYGSAASNVILRTVEEIRMSRDDVKILAHGQLNLALPAFADFHINHDWNYGLELPAAIDAQGVYPALPAVGAIDHARRFSSTVLWEVFGAAPCIDFGGTPAHQVMATSRTTYGHSVHTGFEDFAGFEEYAAHQRELREAGGELLVLHSYPLQALYTKGSERPAACDEMVAILPAQWASAQSFWLLFHGIGGSVEIDEKNMMTINWGDGGFTERKLPGGFWVTEHPSPEAIQPGDVVLIKRKTVQMPDNRGGISS